jgi:small subunit ribosomal protein S8
MTQNYPLADLLTKIRNGQKARLGEVNHMHTKLGQNLLKVFLQEGVISHYYASPRDLHIQLKYPYNQPAISNLLTLSRPGRRLYTSAKGLWEMEKGLGFLVLSTPKGIVSDKEARRLGVGGELLCKVF